MEKPDGTLNIDFAALAASDNEFGKIFSAQDGYVDFQDPETVQQLTKSILKRYFKLQIELPDDRLCPPVPVRYEYIKWLQSLVDTTSPSFTRAHDADREVIGIDIGVGASCIYALLGCASRPSWRFRGTELDEKSFQWATKNITLNDLSSRIHLHKIDSPQSSLLPFDDFGIKHADFVMCNPPFFTSKKDMLATHLTKKRSPSAVCSGADVEMITEGGDLGFVMRILDESQRLGDRVQWYSSMLGKLSSAVALVEALKDRGITNYAVTSLQAGNVTRRWSVAWSWGDLRPRNDVARRNISDKQILPFPTEYKISFEGRDKAGTIEAVDGLLREFELIWSWTSDTPSGLCFAMENVWSRSARRKRKKLQVTGSTEDGIIQNEKKDSNDNSDMALGVKIIVAEKEVILEWLKGSDSVLFESFCGMLKRTVDTKTA